MRLPDPISEQFLASLNEMMKRQLGHQMALAGDVRIKSIHRPDPSMSFFGPPSDTYVLEFVCLNPMFAPEAQPERPRQAADFESTAEEIIDPPALPAPKKELNA